MKVRARRRGDYAVRAMISIARHPVGVRRKARQITDEMGLPERYATQILASLARSGFLTAVVGPDGGYWGLQDPPPRSPSSMWWSGPRVPESRSTSASSEGGPCDLVQVCPMHTTRSEAQQALTARWGCHLPQPISPLSMPRSNPTSTPGRAPRATRPLWDRRGCGTLDAFDKASGGSATVSLASLAHGGGVLREFLEEINSATSRHPIPPPPPVLLPYLRPTPRTTFKSAGLGVLAGAVVRLERTQPDPALTPPPRWSRATERRNPSHQPRAGRHKVLVRDQRDLLQVAMMETDGAACGRQPDPP